MLAQLLNPAFGGSNQLSVNFNPNNNINDQNGLNNKNLSNINQPELNKVLNN